MTQAHEHPTLPMTPSLMELLEACRVNVLQDSFDAKIIPCGNHWHVELIRGGLTLGFVGRELTLSQARDMIEETMGWIAEQRHKHTGGRLH